MCHMMSYGVLRRVTSGSFRLMINKTTRYELTDTEAKLIDESRKLAPMQKSVVIQVVMKVGAKLDMYAPVKEQKVVVKVIAAESVQIVADWRKANPMKPRQ